MLMVVRYLREVKWSAADMNLEGAVLKLERVVKEMEILCDMDRSAARAARKSTSTSAPKPKAKAKSTAETPAESANSGQAEKEAMLDEIFDAIMSGKKRKNDDNAYRPRKKDAELSEEEDDDFVEGENLQEPASTGKRKLIVVDGVTQPPPPKKKKKSKTKGARAAPPPNVDVIEVDDESEDEVGATVEGRKALGIQMPTLQNYPHVLALEIRGVSATSAKIMADFLLEGKLNPAINSTQKNFLKSELANVKSKIAPWKSSSL
ncbi:hypothetical protein MSAN_01956400 [Mycena sanguinolenta]|uniref:Uncharacterized protein n=1 Tax=Mycena sanguinolenta TaxID=230812 RepID=A0A8H6XMG5_9AGAR|nr:hypothetical protein MSAN_01956400 [Mycena sanguinolenta]